MDDSINYEMEYGTDPYANEDSQDSDQQQTQSTQQASQPPVVNVDSHLWGYLQPCSTALNRIDFWKIHPRYTLGRNKEDNQVVLPGGKVSSTHCVITWDGHDSLNSCVLVEDLSSNGTFINNGKIGRGQTRLLRDGNEIAFGTTVPQPHNGGLEDYRFIYRHTSGGLPTEGLYASYDVGTELGTGSFATVRKAIHRTSGQWFAVKMINASKNVGRDRGPARNATFAREISIMEKLDHRNICKLYEVFFQDDNTINLVLELVEGGDLLEHILQNGAGLSEVNARDITYQICDAMAYIHSRGVTHRDLKPENVLLTQDTPPIVKVADFGLAKVVDSLTMLRTMCGTPSYLAPEVVNQENHEGYDNLVDSWSVGVIVFSMITNSSPFLDDENPDIKVRVNQRRVDWGTLRSKNVSREANDFIRGLLEHNPTARLSLTNALQHPWLRDHVPFHAPLPQDGDAPMSPDNGTVDEDLDGYPATSTDPGSQGSRHVPLQRRSEVLSQAAETGAALPEPSWEMMASAAEQEDNSGTSSKGQNKRVHAELSSLPEVVLEDADMNTNRSPDLSSSTPAKPATDMLNENSDGRPRRSTRPNKVPRRA